MSRNTSRNTWYKATNQKPAGLLRIPVYAQRFEVQSINLFGLLSETNKGYTWIFVIEDTCTKWVEVIPLECATSDECVRLLIIEIFFTTWLMTWVSSDNEVQMCETSCNTYSHLIWTTFGIRKGECNASSIIKQGNPSQVTRATSYCSEMTFELFGIRAQNMQ